MMRERVLALVHRDHVRWAIQRGNAKPVLVHAEDGKSAEAVARHRVSTLNRLEIPSTDEARWHVVRKIVTPWERR